MTSQESTDVGTEEVKVIPPVAISNLTAPQTPEKIIKDSSPKKSPFKTPDRPKFPRVNSLEIDCSLAKLVSHLERGAANYPLTDLKNIPKSSTHEIGRAHV